MKISKLFLTTLVTIFLFSMGCKTSKLTETVLNKIPEGEWVMQSMNQKPVDAESFARSLPTIIFTDSTSFSGTTSCNQYMATYKSTPEHFAVKLGPMTKMACPGSGEKEFISALSGANKVTVDKGILTFYKDQTVLMKFKKSKGTKEK